MRRNRGPETFVAALEARLVTMDAELENTMNKNDRLMQWLRDAHAMEKQAETMLSKQAGRIENYPQLKARIERHIEETESQAKRVEQCIERRGGDTSTLKDLAGKTTATAQALGGVFAGDEIVKGAMAGYTFEHFEIASYEALKAAAAEVGDTETEAVCDGILNEERQMAEWLEQHLPEVTRQYLDREASDMEAKV